MLNTSESSKYFVSAERYKSEIAPGTANYNLVHYLKDKINDEIVYIYRFEPDGEPGKINLHHTHVTVIIDNKEKLKGFAHISPQMQGANSLGEERCRELTLSFLKKYAPDLFNSSFQYVNNQKFPLIDKSGKRTDLNGKWVKYRERESGEYLWVMLAPDGSVIEFDRDIVWSFFKGGRVNELWLRDEWLGKKLKIDRK